MIGTLLNFRFIKTFIIFAIFWFFSLPVNADDSYYELNPQWNKAAGVPTVLSICKDIKTNGTQQAYWGIAANLGKDWPGPKADQREAYIKWLCRLGFNFQRINGLDYKRAHLFETWRTAPEDFHDRFSSLSHFLVQLQTHSIAYSLSVNNMSYKYESLDVIKNLHPLSLKRFKYSQIVDPAAIETSVKWHQAIYQQQLPSGKTIAEDRNNVFVTAVGEDSIVAGYFFNKGRFLSPPLRKLLNELFTAYLRQKYSDTDEFYRSWQVRNWLNKNAIGSLETGIALPPVTNLEKLPLRSQQDVLDFLSTQDAVYASVIQRELVQLGYNGLYTFTNDWYGPAVLYTNARYGNMIDIHAYFDHRIKGKNNKAEVEIIRNKSFIQDSESRKDGYIPSFGPNLYHMFGSSIKGLPLFVSEWNHAAWSEYAYEGPLLMTAYASLQEYKGLMIHTLKEWNMDFDQAYITDSFAILGNPIMLALSPTLSYVYRNKLIQPAKNSIDIVLSKNDQDLMGLSANVGLSMEKYFKYAPLNNGFIHKINIIPVGSQEEKQQPFYEPECCNFVSDTGEVALLLSDPHPRLEINTPMFKAIAGRTPSGGVFLDRQHIKIFNHGAVMILALDNLPVEKSKDILITAVKGFKNTGMSVSRLTNYRHFGDAVSIDNTGKAPVLMERVKGEVLLTSEHGVHLRAEAVTFTGKKIPVELVQSVRNGSEYWALQLDSCNAPWYRVTKNEI